MLGVVCDLRHRAATVQYRHQKGSEKSNFSSRATLALQVLFTQEIDLSYISSERIAAFVSGKPFGPWPARVAMPDGTGARGPASSSESRPPPPVVRPPVGASRYPYRPWP